MTSKKHSDFHAPSTHFQKGMYFMVKCQNYALQAFRQSPQPTSPAMSLPVPLQSTRFRQSSSLPRPEAVAERCESADKQEHRSKFTASPDADSSVMMGSVPRPGPHRSSKPLPSILKRKAQKTEPQGVKVTNRSVDATYSQLYPLIQKQLRNIRCTISDILL